MCGHLAIQHHSISMTTHAKVTIEFCLDCCTFMNFVFLLSFSSYALLSQVQINLLNFVQFLEDFFSQKKKKLLKTMENCLRVSLRYPG